MRVFFKGWQTGTIVLLSVGVFGSVNPIHSAETRAETGAKAAKAPIPFKATEKGQSPAPIVVVPGPNGLTISSNDLHALDEFERLLAAAAESSANGPMAVYYLKYANAQSVAEELNKLLSPGASDSPSSSLSKSDASPRSVVATGPFKITPDNRLNALLVVANRADQEKFERLLKTFDLKESPEDVAVAPKPRIIPVEYARATDIAEELREVYADRLVVAPSQAPNEMPQGRRAGMAMFIRGVMGGLGGSRDQGQNPSDRAARISIAVQGSTNSLVIIAADPLFEEVRELVHELESANAEENETVRVISLHGTSAMAAEQAIAAVGGDAVQEMNAAEVKSFATMTRSGSTNTTAATSLWASQSYGRANGGPRSTGNYRPFGGSPSPPQGYVGQRGTGGSPSPYQGYVGQRGAGGSASLYQGFGSQRGSRYAQSGRLGQ